MRYLRQFTIIITVTCIGELLKYLIDLPIPGSIYGLVIMLGLLLSGRLRVEAVRDVALFLVELMPLMFIPGAVGILDSADELKSMLLPLLVIIPLTTWVVMAVSGLITQHFIRRRRR
ncbi:MAG TPA: CidA/LrgA family protein [Candidatus Avilachnospira avicola]|nr:CidA/LrgA family protein [Candidatus Avilachnospira avicola]